MTGSMATVAPGDAYPRLTLKLPAGTVVFSLYSSGAIGRLVPEDVIGLVRYAREHPSTNSA